MNIGLIAHDNKKKLMENLCIAYRHILCKHDIYATGTTGRLVEEAANLVVHKYLSAHLGGEQQMGAQIINNDIDLMIFLRDPVSPHAYESEVIPFCTCAICTIFLWQPTLQRQRFFCLHWTEAIWTGET